MGVDEGNLRVVDVDVIHVGANGSVEHRNVMLLTADYAN